MTGVKPIIPDIGLFIPSPSINEPSPDTVQSARTEAKRRFSQIEGVIGTGVARQNGVPVILINLRQPLPDGTFPSNIMGIALVIRVVGAITAQERPVAHDL